MPLFYVLYLTSYKENVRLLKILVYVNMLKAGCCQVRSCRCGAVHTMLCTHYFCYLIVTTHTRTDGCDRKQKGGGQLIN